MTTRHDIIRRITEALTPLYGHDEARSIALLTAAGLGGVSRTQLLADPGRSSSLRGSTTSSHGLRRDAPCSTSWARRSSAA